MKCGTGLSIVEGSLVQCFNCGAKSVYMESLDVFKIHLLEILNISSTAEENVIDEEEIERRKKNIEKTFHEINSGYNDIKYLIVTKLDELNINNEALLPFLQKAGNLVLIIDSYLLPHLKEGVSKNQFLEIRSLLSIYNKSILGLYFSHLAVEKFQLEDCSKYYQFAERNYQFIVDFCDSIKLSNPSFKIDNQKLLFSVLSKISVLLRNILTENPTYSTEKFEDLFKELDKIKEKNIQVLNLWAQIERVYNLGRDTSLLLEEIRNAELFSLIDLREENIVYNAEENLEKLDRIKDWINQTSEKYQEFQKVLLKLHSGKFMPYLESYRTEFNIRKSRNIERYDEILSRLINQAIGDYNLETMDMLDILSDFIRKTEIDLSNETVIQRFEIEHDDLLKLDEVLKNFIIKLFKKSISKNLEGEFYKEFIRLIADKHAEFDGYILKFINHLLKVFEDYRNEKKLALEEQRNYYILDLKPNINRLIEASFTLNDEIIPAPIFIEIIMLSKQLSVNHPEIITVLLENPGNSNIKNVNISFFMPNSFQSKLRFAQLKKLKAHDKRKIETEIVPTEKGIYHFMVMVEYQTTHIKETFWMPSIKIELEVEEEF